VPQETALLRIPPESLAGWSSRADWLLITYLLHKRHWLYSFVLNQPIGKRGVNLSPCPPLNHEERSTMQNLSETLVFRQVAFPVSAFDYLKQFQRNHERATGIHLNNNQALALILAEHRQSTVESEEQREQTRSPARA